MKKIKISIRGLLKCIPVINPIIEAYRNLKAKAENKEMPHKWLSIIIQFIGQTGAIILFANGDLDKDKLLEILKTFV